MGAVVRVGTCSFADETLTRHWYPRGTRTGEQRLRYYAQRFDTVEIDSPYYSLPDPQRAERWAAATPPGFVFHVKAFAPMTRHPVRLERLPPDLRSEVEADGRGRVGRMAREVRAEIFRRFHEALEPLRRAGKLGGILLQFPPYVVRRPEALADLEWAKEHLQGDEMLVEFRHASWLDEEHRAGTLAFLERLGATYVAVDAPRTGGRNVLPTVPALTSGTAYVRMHGRNVRTWNRRGGSAAERFDHLYSREELAEWIEPLRELASAAERVYVLFNTNGRSRPDGVGRQFVLDGVPADDDGEWIAQGPANAEILRGLLQDAGVRVSAPDEISRDR